eukprot:scaffold6466_cov390-Prasinococcus_capsulatus_cf.AAC.3
MDRLHRLSPESAERICVHDSRLPHLVLPKGQHELSEPTVARMVSVSMKAPVMPQAASLSSARSPTRAVAAVKPAKAALRSSSLALPVRSGAVRTKRATFSPSASLAVEAPAGQGKYNETGKWRENFDLKAWANEVRELGYELARNQNEEDVKHLKKILLWSNMCYFGGLALAAVTNPLLNPIPAFLISMGVVARWTMIGHHVCHGGYNKQQSEGSEVTGRFHRRLFARGPLRRMVDWLDWMLPEAWDVEHNHLHHYQLGESADPDLLERNMAALRASNAPMWQKYAQCYFLMATWKFFYYAPNTLKELFYKRKVEAEKKGVEYKNVDFETGDMPSTLVTVMECAAKGNRAPLVEVMKVLAPYAIMQFMIIPGAFYALFGATAGTFVLANMVLAEIFTNIHAFFIIAPNHVGEDVYRFETTTKPRSDEFYLRAVIGSANYRTGGDVNDFLQGWLNYQIEHHMYPDLSMLSYQKAAPRVREICERHGVPYVQENVFERVRKTLDVMVGKKTMLVYERGRLSNRRHLHEAIARTILFYCHGDARPSDYCFRLDPDGFPFGSSVIQDSLTFVGSDYCIQVGRNQGSTPDCTKDVCPHELRCNLLALATVYENSASVHILSGTCRGFKVRERIVIRTGVWLFVRGAVTLFSPDSLVSVVTGTIRS